ncbi:MAG: energy-coupling factor transporter transmembrane protein EcfT [Candidatus Nanopelagicales bacterium]|nr:energy-coupling factor transporter transmembrane protein EcfT [Candidatus Nanopelagicales bacterium]MCU0297709.1 energy-coupling factor transporter transmembrane protein EcfT [Candidatus Nanopelagicales bacterium]
MSTRWLHPGAWWLWALGLGAAATRTANPLLLGLIVGVVTLVVSARRPQAQWAGAFTVFVRLGLIVIVIRIVFAMLFGVRVGTDLLFTLPSATLPSWMAGVTFGGPVTVEMLVIAAIQGAQLATLLICVGAANSLASPVRLLKALPAGLYHVGVAAVVALSLAPRIMINVRRVMRARRLRGRSTRGLRAAAESAVPVLESSLDDAINLAAAMDTRGYGRMTAAQPAERALQAGLVLVGLTGIALGLFAALGAASWGWLLLVIGLLMATGGIVIAGRRVPRTRYRPDPWNWPETITAGSGILAALAVLAGSTGTISLPLTWPALPPLAVLAILLAAAPALTTPPPPLPWRTA